MGGRRSTTSSTHTTRTRCTFCHRKIPRNTSTATTAPAISHGKGEPRGEKGSNPARHISYADASRRMAACRYMNAACRNFISRDVQPRAANASDIVDGSCDATGRYYTRASLPQAFRHGTNAEPSLFVLCIQFGKRGTATGQSTTKDRNESLKKIALLPSFHLRFICEICGHLRSPLILRGTSSVPRSH